MYECIVLEVVTLRPEDDYFLLITDGKEKIVAMSYHSSLPEATIHRTELGKLIYVLYFFSSRVYKDFGLNSRRLKFYYETEYIPGLFDIGDRDFVLELVKRKFNPIVRGDLD